MTYADDRRRTTSRHDHVGTMRYGTEAALCTSCGQRWIMTTRGWQPLGRYEAGLPEHELLAQGAPDA